MRVILPVCRRLWLLSSLIRHGMRRATFPEGKA
jgi:hypothetical protein